MSLGGCDIDGLGLWQARHNAKLAEKYSKRVAEEARKVRVVEREVGLPPTKPTPGLR